MRAINQLHRSVLVVLLVGVGMGASAAMAQPAPPSNDPNAKDKAKQPGQAQRKAPIDMGAQAKDRRPGQVMPGDAGAAQPAPAAAPPPAPAPALDLPSGAPAKPQSESVRPAPIKPDAGTKPRAAAAVGGATPIAAAPTEPTGIGSPGAPAAYAPARVRVTESGGAEQAEWRGQVGGWQPVATGQATESRVEVRAGLETEAVFVVDDLVEIRVERLGRLTIERAMETDGTTTLSVTLGRGAIEIRPAPGATQPPVGSTSQWLARVRSPDRVLALTAPARLEYDAFAGTRVRMLSGGGR